VNAARKYAERTKMLEGLIERLQDLLEHHGEAAKAKPQHWGFVADLGGAGEHIARAVALLEGEGRESREVLEDYGWVRMPGD